jgi:predicted PurR-regulated permease PerM
VTGPEQAGGAPDAEARDRASGLTLQPRSADGAEVLRLVRWLLIGLIAVIAAAALKFLAAVLTPILAALGIAYLLDPIVERLARRGLSRSLAAGLILGGFLTAAITAVVVLVPRLASQVTAFVEDLPRMVDNLRAWSHAHLHVDLPEDWTEAARSDHLKQALTDAAGPLRDVLAAAVGGVFEVLATLAELLLVPVFAFYFLVDWRRLLERGFHLIPPRSRGHVRELLREVDRVVAGWIHGQTIVTLILAVLYVTGFSLVGMPLSVPIGLIVALLTVIPFIGTFVGASLALLVTLADGGGAGTLGSVAGVILALHLLEAAVLTPKIVGHRVGLSESAALFAVVAGGKLLGFVGVVLAVPIAATTGVVVRALVRYYEHTTFFGSELDADVEITPAMATIMPGPIPGHRISGGPAASAGEAASDPLAEIELATDTAPPPRRPSAPGIR